MNISGMIAFVMFVGAARHDASPEQLEQLRSLIDLCGDEMRASNEGMATALLNVQEIMGDWTPTGDWADWIDKMLEPTK